MYVVVTTVGDMLRIVGCSEPAGEGSFSRFLCCVKIVESVTAYNVDWLRWEKTKTPKFKSVFDSKYSWSSDGEVTKMARWAVRQRANSDGLTLWVELMVWSVLERNTCLRSAGIIWNISAASVNFWRSSLVEWRQMRRRRVRRREEIVDASQSSSNDCCDGRKCEIAGFSCTRVVA